MKDLYKLIEDVQTRVNFLVWEIEMQEKDGYVNPATLARHEEVQRILNRLEYIYATNAE